LQSCTKHDDNDDHNYNGDEDADEDNANNSGVITLIITPIRVMTLTPIIVTMTISSDC